MAENKSVVVKNSSIMVDKTIGKHGSDQGSVSTEEENIISVHQFQTVPAEVEVSIGLTINTGNFNSVRLNVSVRIPCYKEEIDDAYAYAQKWAEDRVQHEKTMIDNYRDSKQKNPF